MVTISLNVQVVEIMQINVRSLMEREQRLAELDNRAGKATEMRQRVEKCFVVFGYFGTQVCALIVYLFWVLKSGH
jgi:hypothetical protein